MAGNKLKSSYHIHKMKKSIIFLLLAMFCFQLSFGQKKHMKFISYNILQGMRLDSLPGKPAFVSWAKQQDPDVMALQEVTGFSQAKLEKLAASYGHPYASLLTEGIKYPVAITSKYPIKGIRKITEGMDRGLIIAEVEGFHVAVLHLTPFDYRKRRSEVQVVLSAIQSAEDSKQWVLMGDFNTVSPADSANYSDGRLVRGYLNYEKKYPPILKLADGKIDYSVIQSILDCGFIDALKLKHTAFIKTVHPKAFEPKKGPDVSSRIDFIFVSDDLKHSVSSAAVIADAFTEVSSDHYPVSVKITTKK